MGVNRHAYLERSAAYVLRCVQEIPKQVHSKVRDCPPCCFSFQVYKHPAIETTQSVLKPQADPVLLPKTTQVGRFHLATFLIGALSSQIGKVSIFQ